MKIKIKEKSGKIKIIDVSNKILGCRHSEVVLTTLKKGDAVLGIYQDGGIEV